MSNNQNQAATGTLQPLETVQYWAREFAKDPQRLAGGMIVRLLREYADLRAQLARQGQGKAVFYARQIDLDHQVPNKPYVVSKEGDGNWSVPLYLAAPASAQLDRGAAPENRCGWDGCPHGAECVHAVSAAAPHSQPVRAVPDDGWTKAMRDLVRVLRGVECGEDSQWKFIANVCENAEELLAQQPYSTAQEGADGMGGQ